MIAPEATQRLAAVVGDHVGERGDDVDVRAPLGTVELGVTAVEVADDPLAIVPLGELTQVGLERGVEGRQPRGLALPRPAARSRSTA